MNKIYGVLLQNLFSWEFTLFCCQICFVVIYADLCGEKLSQKLNLWRQNDKYQVRAQMAVAFSPILPRGALPMPS